VKILIDMNLTPEWVGFLAAKGIAARHWFDTGDPKAIDARIMKFVWRTGSPSSRTILISATSSPRQTQKVRAIQVRTQDPIPRAIGELVATALVDYRELERGALVTIELTKMRSRVLPLFPGRRH
jgi:predicted nuclease of predicted toxin-antitoxin system